MIATFYQWRIDPKNGEAFRAAWREATDALKKRGSGGSTLFCMDHDHYCALARWPDAKTRDAAFAAEKDSPESVQMRGFIKATIDKFDLDEIDHRWRSEA